MKEVRPPRRPLIYFYVIAILCLLLFNILLLPWFAQRQIQLVDYGTFLDMADRQEIGLVEVQEEQILFTGKDGTTYYKTGRMDDPALVDRLQDSGTSSGRPRKRPPASSLLTRSTPLAKSGTASWGATTSGSRPSTSC